MLLWGALNSRVSSKRHTVFVLDRKYGWIRTRLQDLKKGEVFLLFEPGGYSGRRIAWTNPRCDPVTGSWELEWVREEVYDDLLLQEIAKNMEQSFE
jgi:hypothetical protein